MILHFAFAAGRAFISERISCLGLLDGGVSEILTVHSELHKQDDTGLETDNIENKVTEIVGSDTVVDPRAVTDI